MLCKPENAFVSSITVWLYAGSLYKNVLSFLAALHLPDPLFQESGGLFPVQVVVDLLVVVVAQAVVAGAVAAAAVHNRQRPPHHRLKGRAVLGGNAANVPRAAGHGIVENQGVDHRPLHRSAEEASLDIGSLNAHLLGQSIQQGVEDGQHGVIVCRLRRPKGELRHVGFEIVGQAVLRALVLLIRAGVGSNMGGASITMC